VEKTIVVTADRQKRLVSVDEDVGKADKRVVNVNPARSADLCVTVGKETARESLDDGSSRKRKKDTKKAKSTRRDAGDSDDDAYGSRRR
jgi:hypothetical protein